MIRSSSFVVGLHRDRAGVEGPHDVGHQPARGHHDTVDVPTTVGRDLDGQIEVGAGDPQQVARRLQADPGQHRAGRRLGWRRHGRRCLRASSRTSRSHRNFTGCPSSSFY